MGRIYTSNVNCGRDYTYDQLPGVYAKGSKISYTETNYKLSRTHRAGSMCFIVYMEVQTYRISRFQEIYPAWDSLRVKQLPHLAGLAET